MKLSLAWIFDHIDADWKSQNIDEIVRRFNAVTAEIEGVHAHCIDLSPYSMAQVLSVDEQSETCSVLIPAHNETVDMSLRSDAKSHHYYMVKAVHDYYEWATLADFESDKKGLLPAFDVTKDLALGGWKEHFEHDDIIIDVDNKSITHRPDMWGHRGFAREIAAFMELPFKDAAWFLKEQDVLYSEKQSKPTLDNPYIIDNQAPDKCSRFCGLYLPLVKNKPSQIKMASRLLKVGGRPMNALVDITNYILFDWSQPVHAYDASKIIDRKIVIRKAHDQERLDLLGDETITLIAEDLVIADAQKPICLAGVKGGKHDSLSDESTAIFFEAATFDAGSVRRSAFRHKMRTDSSARFEKTLNEEQTLEAVFRFKALLDECDIQATCASEVMVVGKQHTKVTVDVTHEFLERRSGLRLDLQHIVDPLTRLGFIVDAKGSGRDADYHITIPPFRASKDVAIKEDILEEVVRSYGYDRIPLMLPMMTHAAYDMSRVMRLRKIKQFFAHTAQMTEQQNYSFFDEAFLASLDVTLESPISVVNPVSENMSRLVTSLIPGLLKNIRDNHVHKERLAFFECGRVWQGTVDDTQEIKTIAGIMLDKHHDVDFYLIKQHLLDLFSLLHLPSADIAWNKVAHDACPSWFSPFQTAALQYGDQLIGMVGRLNPLILDKLGLTDACGMMFELSNDFLLTQQIVALRMKPISKYQDTYFDVSLLVPLHIQAASLFEPLNAADDLIVKTELIDFFEQESWHDQRSLTLRFWLSDSEKTLEKEHIDSVRESVLTIALAYGARLRA